MKNGYYLLIGVLFLLVACGGGGEDPSPEPPPVVVVTPPSAATLIFPENNTECNEGEILNDSQSSVRFQWNASQNTDTYELNLRNLNNNNTARTNANTNEATITLLRGTPYEWFVISRANGTNETATSPAWKFYNQGPGVENYAPFPAEVVRPARGATVGATGTVILEWTGSDVDNDLSAFDVYFDTNESPVTQIATTSETSLETAISAATVYYWRIVSRDSQGNTSESEIFEFRVQ
jgi:hypothetical protein